LQEVSPTVLIGGWYILLTECLLLSLEALYNGLRKITVSAYERADLTWKVAQLDN
jgi:hypothetical protein